MNSFIENVNYLASLDNNYGDGIVLSKNNLSLRNVENDIELKFSYFNYDTKQIETVDKVINGMIYTGLETALQEFCTQIESALGGNKFDASYNISSTNTGFLIHNFSITINSLDEKLKCTELNFKTKITSTQVYIYNIYGEVTNHLKLLAVIAMLEPEFVDAIPIVYENIDSIISVNSNTDLLNDIANEIIPNINEILEADNNAIIASQKASEASASASSALEFKNSASNNAAIAIANADASLINANSASSSAANASSSESNALNSANLATEKANSILNLDVEMIELTHGSDPTTDYNSGSGVLTIGIPEVIDGADGASVTDITSSKVGKVTTVNQYIDGVLSNTFTVNDGLDSTGDMSKTTYDTNNSGVVDDSEKLNGQSGSYYLDWGNTTDKPTTVDGYGITDAVKSDEVKTINGTSILGTGNIDIAAGSGGYAANVYLTSAVSSTVGSYNKLSYTPDVSETTIAVVVNNNELLVADYIFDGDVLATLIPAGEWEFNFQAQTSSTQATTFLKFEVFKRTSGGTETVLFSRLSPDFTVQGSVEAIASLGTQPQYSVGSTDRIGIKVYASTTRTSNTTVTLYIGDGRASYFNTPLEIRHSQLRARDEADSHPISAITGLTATLDAINASLGDINSALDTINGEVI